MKGSHVILILLGAAAQGFGWHLAPRRMKGLLGGLALGLGSAWFLWYLNNTRSLSVTGFWSLTPLATWICLHMVIVPVIAVEAVARALPGLRWWVRGVGVALIILGYGWGLGEAYGPPMVTETSLAFSDLPPAFEGYRIVLVGDIHAGPFAGTRTLGRWARAIQALHGDVLVAAGDFVARVPEEAERTGVAFESVIVPDGRLGVLGNHDQYFGQDEVGRRLRRHGWVMLENQALAIERRGQRLVFLGAEFYDRDRVPAALPSEDRPFPEGFRIGVCHTPWMWPLMIHEGARLTLAAHTHGGQVNLSPVFNMAEEISPYVHGAFTDGANRLFVTQGLGLTQFPFRLRCRPEIVLITLHKA